MPGRRLLGVTWWHWSDRGFLLSSALGGFCMEVKHSPTTCYAAMKGSTFTLNKAWPELLPNLQAQSLGDQLVMAATYSNAIRVRKFPSYFYSSVTKAECAAVNTSRHFPCRLQAAAAIYLQPEQSQGDFWCSISLWNSQQPPAITYQLGGRYTFFSLVCWLFFWSVWL